MKSSRAPVLFLLLGLTLSSRSVRSDESGPGTRAVKRANETIRALLAKQVTPDSSEEKALASEVTEKVRDFLDVEFLGRLALSDHISSLNNRQIEAYITLLRQLIEQNYIKGLRANLKYDVVYLGEQGDENKTVRTEIHTMRKGRPYTIRVDYVLRKIGSRWQAYDIITDGVGLVRNYRSQFNRIIAKEGFAGLLKRMRNRYRQIQQDDSRPGPSARRLPRP